MKKAWNIFGIVFLILAWYFLADFIFVLGVNYGRELERKIEVIESEDEDQVELQRWENRYMEVRHVANQGSSSK